MLAYYTDKGETILLLDNEGIIYTGKKGSILSVTHMRAYGTYVDESTTIFNRDDKKGRSILITDGHEVKFKLQDGLQILHVNKANEDDLKACLVV